jgi:hypothetical protein
MRIRRNLWSRVRVSGECWLWTGALTRAGYGLLTVGGQQKYAHRLAYETTVGRVPPGYCVCHACDTPACIRPEHLFIGTQADNLHDAGAKGRLHVLTPAERRRGHAAASTRRAA